MTINTIPKEMPTGDGNPTAGSTINDLNFPTAERNDKAFSSLRAAFALKGHALHQTDPADGAVTYYDGGDWCATCPPLTRHGGSWSRSGGGCDHVD